MTLTITDVVSGDASINKMIAELDELFPPFNASPTNSIQDIMYRSGQRSVVEFIKQKLEN